MTTKKEVWVVAVHSQANFNVICVVDSEIEAKKITESLKDMGRVLIWKAEEAAPYPKGES